MPRGGRRTGTPGKTYTNRADLNTNRGPVPMMAATGQAYGQRAEQMAAQRAMPVAAPPAPAMAPPPAPAGPPAGGALAPSGPMPGELGFADPSGRPGEPVTAGVPVGPGPSGVDQPVGMDSPLRLRLGAMYQAFPTEELRSLIEQLDEGVA